MSLEQLREWMDSKVGSIQELLASTRNAMAEHPVYCSDSEDQYHEEATEECVPSFLRAPHAGEMASTDQVTQKPSAYFPRPPPVPQFSSVGTAVTPTLRSQSPVMPRQQQQPGSQSSFGITPKRASSALSMSTVGSVETTGTSDERSSVLLPSSAVSVRDVSPVALVSSNGAQPSGLVAGLTVDTAVSGQSAGLWTTADRQPLSSARHSVGWDSSVYSTQGSERLFRTGSTPSSGGFVETPHPTNTARPTDGPKSILKQSSPLTSGTSDAGSRLTRGESLRSLSPATRSVRSVTPSLSVRSGSPAKHSRASYSPTPDMTVDIPASALDAFCAQDPGAGNDSQRSQRKLRGKSPSARLEDTARDCTPSVRCVTPRSQRSIGTPTKCLQGTVDHSCDDCCFVHIWVLSNNSDKDATPKSRTSAATRSSRESGSTAGRRKHCKKHSNSARHDPTVVVLTRTEYDYLSSHERKLLGHELLLLRF
jgi:hypothetical protein